LRDFHEQQKMKPLVLDNYKAACAVGLFRVFGDADRVRIVSAILEQEMNISTLAEMVGMTESAVSHLPICVCCGRCGWSRPIGRCGKFLTA
jgi:hypothetical protein